ncbi:MAG TPA: cyclic nucleotide-binding domain-containing protein [Feifaniaceae bacterium]|nr:cyclic nucleotide-binding domain-containing protein [Feifaniaceae bacterium]
MQKVKNAQKLQYYKNRLLQAGPDCFRFLAKYPFELFSFAREDNLCTYGESMPYLLLLMEGKAKIFLTLENGKTLLVAFIEAVELLGDLELCTDRVARNSVRATTEAYCLGVPMAYCGDVMLKDPVFLRLISGELAKKLDNCASTYAVNMLYPLPSRLAGYLLYMEEDGFFKENLGALSEYLGTSYRHLLRVFHEFLESGLVARAPGGYRILDRAALMELAGGVYGQGV